MEGEGEIRVSIQAFSELIRSALKLPKDFRLAHVETDYEFGAVLLYGVSREYPRAAELAPISRMKTVVLADLDTVVRE